MTPAARVAAAIEILDRIQSGMPTERALTNWARASRFAGSKDRAAIRDHVFDVRRRWHSTAQSGGGESGRARMIGLLRQQGADLAAFFTGEGHAPGALTAAESYAPGALDGASHWDLPDWAIVRLQSDLPDAAQDIAQSLRHRAELFLRVNTLRGSRAAAQALLAEDGIETEPSSLSPTALRVLAHGRRVSQSAAYAEGMVELQDAASQAVVDALPLRAGDKVLDYCAGGGGKALAMAARIAAPIDAFDADPARMSDLPQRALRAGADIRPLSKVRGRYDLVLCDVPCSGSGAWRRAPDGKWRLTEPMLHSLCTTQAGIIDTCSQHVADGGALAYATCSVFHDENEAQIAQFLSRKPGWQVERQEQFLPNHAGDGLFVAVLRFIGR